MIQVKHEAGRVRLMRTGGNAYGTEYINGSDLIQAALHDGEVLLLTDTEALQLLGPNVPQVAEAFSYNTKNRQRRIEQLEQELKLLRGKPI